MYLIRVKYTTLAKGTGKIEKIRLPHSPDSRFPIPDSRFPIPDSRFPIPDSRFPILDSLKPNRKPG
ncbi:MAG: hypothetical protein F6K50_20945 [Moorea sp. SIO3I7]|uniref:hypothetical protein n=1 Tax=unclassified Moorena TaxID=2683338 RepID=UPI0013BECF70|nr:MULTISPECIES: hypothetical protein [unclassified Moorena]NEN97893.1 hypothetical protein [Moorena sp. SIO3I7]NEO05368.1 hypothetical protein [Moorena sp. SIO3I8]NEP22533.1 hypothetical protein [Moorena sp. SIO3I6]